jgi:tyrosyl-tRNA synthetase
MTSSKRSRKPADESDANAASAKTSQKPEVSALQREVLQELREVFLRGTIPEAKARDNIVMTRIWDSDLRIVDALIDLEIFKSRSEAVAFLVHEGIQAKREVVDTILPAIERIEEIKRQTRQQAVSALHKLKGGSRE